MSVYTFHFYFFNLNWSYQFRKGKGHQSILSQTMLDSGRYTAEAAAEKMVSQ